MMTVPEILAGPVPETLGAAGCGDLYSDPQHCGACSHDCQGGACTAGLCQPAVIGQAGPGKFVQLVVDESHLFLAITPDYEQFRVSKMPKSGGSLEEILPQGELGIEDFVSLGDSLYLVPTISPAEIGGARAIELPKSGGATSVVWEHEEGLPYRMTADKQHLFLAVSGESGGGGVHVIRVNPADKSWVDVTKIPNGWSSRIAVDDSFVYVRVDEDQTVFVPGAIYRAAKQGGDPELLVDSSPNTAGLFLGGSYLYYLLRDEEPPNAPSNLMRIPKSGGPANTVIDELPAFSITPAALDEDAIWWIRRQAGYTSEDTSVLKTPFAGGASTVVATEAVKSDFASDATFIYWVRQSGAVMRLAR